MPPEEKLARRFYAAHMSVALDIDPHEAYARFAVEGTIGEFWLGLARSTFETMREVRSPEAMAALKSSWPNPTSLEFYPPAGGPPPLHRDDYVPPINHVR